MTRWRKRGVGWPIKYGPAHRINLKKPTLMGWTAYCGVWLPAARDHLWGAAKPDDRKCPKCVKLYNAYREDPMIVVDDRVRITLTGAVQKGATGYVKEILPNHWLGQGYIKIQMLGGGFETLPMSAVEKIG
jgi:hypothetical protein